MTVIEIVMGIFVLLELSNIVTMYFFPSSKKANSVGVFTAWEQSKQYPEIHEFIKYLVYWVTGSKLIFIFLLVVIIVYGEPALQRMSLLALTVAVASFYWRLFPLIRKMDRRGKIEPQNYSLILGGLIFGFIVMFVIALVVG
ncbi:MAG TPA: hypothetical protein VLL52_10735 [Anaerolineae bacterium]|nr:hypothetical protein [Anaerolineae bacterium]